MGKKESQFDIQCLQRFFLEQGSKQLSTSLILQFSSVQLLSHVWYFMTPWTVTQPGLPVHSQLLGPYSNSCPSHRWCHPIISFSVVPFSSCLQSFPASGSFPMSWFFISGGQSIGVSASASVLPMNMVESFPFMVLLYTILYLQRQNIFPKQELVFLGPILHGQHLCWVCQNIH